MSDDAAKYLVLGKDEWYPVFDFEKADKADLYGNRTVKVDTETARRWIAAVTSFKLVQQEMGDAWEAANRA